MLVSVVCVQERATVVPVALAVRPSGWEGTGMGVAETSPDAPPVPMELTARTLNLYSVLLVRPVTV